MRFNNNQKAFISLLRAGLWETEVQVSGLEPFDYTNVFHLADNQAVIGIVTAGMEKISDVKVPKDKLFTFIGTSVQIETLNQSMNQFLGYLIDLLRKREIYTLLVKGQGIAQCYSRPLWRSCGDIDLLLSEENYIKAKQVLTPLATNVEREYLLLKHLGMTINGFSVELHGSLRSRLTKRIDRGIDRVQDECFLYGEVRSWMNDRTQIFLPAPDQDVLFVFTHILHHFFIEGIGLKQICDWIRLIWTFRDKIDARKIGRHLKDMGLLSEWRAFSALAVDWLGMPLEAMPLYSGERKWSKKAILLLNRVLMYDSTTNKEESIIKTFANRTLDAFKMMRIFPVDAWKVYFGVLRSALIFRTE